MSELTVEQIKNYLKQAITVETDIATQEQIIGQFNENALIRKPTLRRDNLPEKPACPVCESFRIFSNDNPHASLAFIGTILIVFVLSMVVAVGDDLEGVESFLLIVFIAGLCLFLPSLVKKSSVNKEYKKTMEFYQQSLEAYNEKAEKIKSANVNYEEQYSKNLSTWNHSNTKVKAVMDKSLAESRIVLDKLYSLEYIYPKYRNLPALTSIYEYFLTGRCEGLTGPHGAYNLYEDELRKDMVISQLSVVIQNLEQIKQNQYMLYQQVKEIQQTTSSIESELRQIKGYTVQIASLTALNTFYSALAERNTRVSMWCDIL